MIREKCKDVSQLEIRNLNKLIPRLKECLAVKLTCCIPERPKDRKDLFLLLLETGVPIALWSRSDKLPNVDGKFDMLLAPESICNLDQLLRQIKEEREQAHIETAPNEHLGYHLGILCDEQNRLIQLNQFIKENNLWGWSA